MSYFSVTREVALQRMQDLTDVPTSEEVAKSLSSVMPDHPLVQWIIDDISSDVLGE